MAFSAFGSLKETARTYQISVVMERFVQVKPYPVNEAFTNELEFVRKNIDVRVSEIAIGEFIIAPVLKEIWKAYSDTFLMWSHAPFGTEAPLVGAPDYYFSRKSPLGLMPDQPDLIVAEAKKDDFDAGWGQCLAAMLAAQKMNGQTTWTVYGCVSNGNSWSFGKLEGRAFTQELQEFGITDLPRLFGALDYIFARAKEQVQAAA